MSNFLIYRDIIAAQTPDATIEFKKILDNFDLIVEIGTSRGGFTMWLGDNKPEGCECISLEIDEKNIVAQHENVTYMIGDCFWSNIVYDINEKIVKSRRALILCDGGNKEKEFELYSQMLRTNDVIMTHDYAHTLEEYNTIKEKIGWPSPSESHYDNIINSVTKNSLQMFMYDEFKQVLWGSFIKI